MSNRNSHKYAELADALRLRIVSGEIAPGARLPSENELAASIGYSRQTVRQAIGLLENEGLARRVQGSGTFARTAAPHREATHNIAVVTTYIGEYIFPALLSAIDETLEKNGYTPLLSATRNKVDNERRILSELLQKPIDGLIAEGTKTALPNPNLDLYEAFAARGIPVVFINGFYPDLKKPVYVVADDREGGRLACEALLRAGHTRIAGIFKSDDVQGHRRYAGYAAALCAAGLPVSDDAVLWYTTERRDELFAACLPQVLAGCTAVVCYNDEVALWLVRRGLAENHAPLAIASFDHSTYAELSPVAFLSLVSPKEELGRLAAEKLLHILRGGLETPTVLPWSIEP